VEKRGKGLKSHWTSAFRGGFLKRKALRFGPKTAQRWEGLSGGRHSVWETMFAESQGRKKRKSLLGSGRGLYRRRPGKKILAEEGENSI